MAGRQLFSESEKFKLQELIVKYKLNSNETKSNGNLPWKKSAWVCLTKEYNADQTNARRTETQLRKCWDNLKTRRKQALREGKRERKNTGGELYCQQLSTSKLETIDDPLNPSRSSVSRLSDYDAASSQTSEATDELTLKKHYKRAEEREEELHKLKIREREWRVKCAEEQYQKACIERKCAEEELRCTRAKREAAELSLLELKNKDTN